MTKTKEIMYEQLLDGCGIVIPENYFEQIILPEFVNYNGTYDAFCIKYTHDLISGSIEVIENLMNQWEDLYINNQNILKDTRKKTKI